MNSCFTSLSLFKHLLSTEKNMNSALPERSSKLEFNHLKSAVMKNAMNDPCNFNTMFLQGTSE